MSCPHYSASCGLDLLSFVFDREGELDNTQDVYINANDPSQALTARQTERLVRMLVAGFRDRGLQPGDSVLVILANNFLYASIYFSIIGAGGVYIGANPASQPFELGHLFRLAEPKIVITQRDVLIKVQQALQENPLSTPELFVLEAEDFPLETIRDAEITPRRQLPSTTGVALHETTDLSRLLDHGESDWIGFQDEDVARKTPAAMFLTSGTSGLPKAAILTHHALVSQHQSMESVPLYEVRRLISLPFFHVFAALFAHNWPIRNGQPLHILPRFQAENYLNAIQKYQITDTVMAPPMVHKLNQSSSPIEHRLSSIRWIGVGGAPIAKEAMQEFERHLHPMATLSQVWGMTEIGVAMLVEYPERECWGSIGRPQPGYEMRLIDAFNNVVENDHEPGTLQVKFDGMMLGYKNQSPQPVGEWYDTGDIMSRVNGKYFVVGRSKELIKVNGFQVAPAEIEAVLLTHPCIVDAGVIGSLREDGVTEVPRAYIVRAEAFEGRCSTLTTEDIYAYSKERLTSYKALNGGIFFIDSIPRTASGKIQRFKLAQMDQYRRSITELLAHNQAPVSSEMRGVITTLKSQADDAGDGIRRSARIAATILSANTTDSNRVVKVDFNSGDQNTLIKPSIRPATPLAKPKRRSRTSLVRKMKALEASRIIPHVEASLTV